MRRDSSKTLIHPIVVGVLATLLVTLLISCDGAVQLCGQYACVAYQNDSDCEASHSCNRPRQCESASSIRDRAPRIINELREAQRSCGASTGSTQIISTEFSPVFWDAQLASVSVSHARDMASNTFESFVGTNGLSTTDRAVAAGINSPIITESVSVGPQTSAEAMNGWLDISTDCNQLLDSQLTRLGMACEVSGADGGGPYWSLLLAAPEQ